MPKKYKLKTKSGENKYVYDALVYNLPHKNLDEKEKKMISREIAILLKNNWGEFEENFIEKHVLSSRDLALLRTERGSLIGLAAISEKKICNRLVDYFELTVVDKKHGSMRLSFLLNLLLMRRAIIRNFLTGKYNLEFMLITPNMKVLGSLANLASFIYPNPYDYDVEKKKVPQADEETWYMAKELIAQSDHPDRKISREGLVLEDSYRDTPWLIYESGREPKYKDGIVNLFGQRYLEYGKKTGKELVVRVKFSFRDIIRGVFK